ncbi:MAG: sulfatase-like hydrolase/transferase [Flavobacteriales bacterium]|nr:sulfatase-like hydrolase/transferase [Flavobacteriales bacterium]
MRIFGAVPQSLTRGPLAALLARFAALAAIYTLLRIAFVLLNRDSFPNVPFTAFLGGIRFDLSALAWLNLPWLLLYLIEPDDRGWFGAAKRIIFHIGNAAGFFFACADIEYFKFTLKRSTADLFGIMSGGDDVTSLATTFVVDYWHIVLLFICCIAMAELGYRLGGRLITDEATHWARRIMWRVVAAGCMVLFSRGGVQLIPIGVMNAADHVPAPYFPVVLNTPFTLMMTMGKPSVEELSYMTPEEADRFWPVEHRYIPATLWSDSLALKIPKLPQKPNVVVIILESFSAAYSAQLSGGEGHMPFLDSLMRRSLHFARAYANGRRSIDGIPAITASLPEWMEEAFITSPYAQTPFTSLANVLAAEGYRTSFYHGGRNGTMGFDGFARAAGYQRYMGLNEYPLASDYDGAWGIWDRPYLRYFANELDQEPQPFHSTVFTLSSHHPYALPAAEAERFPQGKHRIHAALRYADDALREFFDVASTKPWFDRTLFVITADHTADLDRTGQDYSEASDYWVPLLYYMPAAIAPERSDQVTQHIDIVPTILDLIGHKEPFFSFGATALRDERVPLAIMRTSGGYLAIDDERAFRFDGQRLPAPPIDQTAYHAPDSVSVRTLQAALQQFTHRMLHGPLQASPVAP